MRQRADVVDVEVRDDDHLDGLVEARGRAQDAEVGQALGALAAEVQAAVEHDIDALDVEDDA